MIYESMYKARINLHSTTTNMENIVPNDCLYIYMSVRR